MIRCDCCGKFRRDCDVIIQEDWNFDNMVCDLYTECEHCMSPEDKGVLIKQESEK